MWSPYTKQNIQKIEMVQRRAARWVSNSYSSYDSVSAMLSNLGWRSLEYRRNDSRLAMFYMIQYGLIALPMPSYFERPIRITRHMHPLSFRLVHVSGIRFFPMTAVLWNRLPADLGRGWDPVKPEGEVGFRKTGLSPPVFFIDRSKAVLLLWFIFIVFACCMTLWPL